MSRTVTIDGESYVLPTLGDKGWLARLNELLIALVDLATETAEQPAPAAIVSWGALSADVAGSTQYLFPWAESQVADVLSHHVLIPQAGNLSNFHIRADVASDVDFQFSIRVNGSDILSITLPDGDQTASDTDPLNAVSVSAGDRVAVSLAPAEGGIVNLSRPILSCVFTPS